MKPKRAVSSKTASVLVRVTIGVMKYHDQSNLARIVFVSLILPYY